MLVTLTYDDTLHAFTARTDPATLRTAADVVAWGRELEAAIERAGARIATVLVDLDGLEVEMAVKEEFGELCRTRLLAAAAALRFVGRGDGFTTTVLWLESVKGPACLRPLRATDVRAELARLRRKPPTPAAVG